MVLKNLNVKLLSSNEAGSSGIGGDSDSPTKYVQDINLLDNKVKSLVKNELEDGNKPDKTTAEFLLGHARGTLTTLNMMAKPRELTPAELAVQTR